MFKLMIFALIALSTSTSLGLPDRSRPHAPPSNSKGLANQTATGTSVTGIHGTNGYVEYQPGDMNLIITAPHGGRMKPPSIPERKDDGSGDVNLIADAYTLDIAMGVTEQIQKITGRKPHLVFSNLHRSRLDPNREEDVAAQGNPEAVTAYREYHQFILSSMLAAAPAQLKISSTGLGSKGQPTRMGEYYLTQERYNNYPVYRKVDNSQVVYVNDHGNWVVFSRLDPKVRSLRNTESGSASPSPPVQGWEFWDRGSSSWVRDPKMRAESVAPPYVTISSTGAAAAGQPTRRGCYHLLQGNHNNHPVYKKEDNSQLIYVNDKGEWVVFYKIDPKMRSLRNMGRTTAIPPRDGWQFWNKDSDRWRDDPKLRVDPPTALLLDIHGQAHGKNSTELGYLISKSQLNAGWYSADKTSIRELVLRTGLSVGQMLHGSKSLGAMFENAGYKAFPSPRQPSPQNDTYYRGGFTILNHGSKDGGPVDAIQIEAPSEVRSGGGKAGRVRFTLALAQIIQIFYDEFYES